MTAIETDKTTDLSKDVKVEGVRRWLESPAFKRQLARSIRTGVNPDTIARMALTLAQRNRKLLDCTPASFAGALIECCQVGLEPDGVMGQAYFVPYGTTCTLIIGYRGLIQLSYNSGKIKAFTAFAVYAKDEFDVQFGSDPKITHRPYREEDRGELIATYAVVHLKESDIPVTKVLWRHEIEAVMARSQSAKSGQSPWKTDFEAMAIKTAVKRVCKFIPTSPNLQRAVSIDDQAEAGIDQTFIDLDPMPESDDDQKSRTKKLGKELADKKPKAAPKAEEKAQATVKKTQASKDDSNSEPRQRLKKAILDMEPGDREAWMTMTGLKILDDLDDMKANELESISEALP